MEPRLRRDVRCNGLYRRPLRPAVVAVLGPLTGGRSPATRWRGARAAERRPHSATTRGLLIEGRPTRRRAGKKVRFVAFPPHRGAGGHGARPSRRGETPGAEPAEPPVVRPSWRHGPAPTPGTRAPVHRLQSPTRRRRLRPPRATLARCRATGDRKPGTSGIAVRSNCATLSRCRACASSCFTITCNSSPGICSRTRRATRSEGPPDAGQCHEWEGGVQLPRRQRDARDRHPRRRALDCPEESKRCPPANDDAPQTDDSETDAGGRQREQDPSGGLDRGSRFMSQEGERGHPTREQAEHERSTTQDEEHSRARHGTKRGRQCLQPAPGQRHTHRRRRAHHRERCERHENHQLKVLHRGSLSTESVRPHVSVAHRGSYDHW